MKPTKAIRLILALAALLPLTRQASGQANVLQPIQRGPISIKLVTVASGLAAPDFAISPPGDTTRLFVVEQKGQILILQNGALLPAPALDISTLVAPPLVITSANDERGLLGLAFHPGYNTPSSPGYRTLYTYNSQPLGTGVTFAAPNGASQGYKNAVNEWKVSGANPNVIDAASRREIISFGKNANNHNGGTIAFGPDGLLYIGLGDGGNANDVGASHIEPGGNAQNLTTPMGKMLRIDPLNPTLTTGSPNPASPNGQYRIPATNPFQSAGQVRETYAYGFRNPYRFAFDRLNGQLIMADVGQNTVEEINRVTLGGNYGWAIKEGDFLFNRTTGPGGTAGTVGARSAGSPLGLIDPISGPAGTLEYDHDDGISITGGFVYRGSGIPDLYGKYVFGDLALHRTPTRADGRLFYADLESGEIKEFDMPQFVGGILPNGLTVHGFGEDGSGELYALATNTASSGTGGVIYAIKKTPVVWTGPSITFSKPAGANHLLPENQDRLTGAVTITRASAQGIFNIASESTYTHNLSPAGTEWAYGTTANYAALTYQSWEAWNGGAGGGPPSTVDRDAVLHLIAEDIYLNIKFTAWGGSGGQFSYTRSTPSPLAAWRLQYFNTLANAGSAENSADPDLDGIVNLAEYAFGLDPKQGGSITLPQAVLTGGSFRVSFTQPAGVSGVTYRAEWSPSLSLQTWTPVADTGAGTTHTFDVPTGSKSRVFMRYLVTAP